MAQLNLYDAFWTDLCTGVHNFSSHTFKVALSNTTPNQTTHAVLADVTAISLTNLGGSHTITLSASVVSHRLELSYTDYTETATGSVGPFQYLIIYNDTATGDPLVGWFALASARTLASTYALNLNNTTSPALRI